MGTPKPANPLPDDAPETAELAVALSERLRVLARLPAVLAVHPSNTGRGGFQPVEDRTADPGPDRFFTCALTGVPNARPWLVWRVPSRRCSFPRFSLQSRNYRTKEPLNDHEAPMAWKDKSSATFTGGSGQVAVMGELLHRQCNAAIPHVDVGTDVFAFRDDREEVARIQVKTAPGQRYKNGKGYRAKFGIPMVQLDRTDNPQLFYALAVRLGNRWESFIVISRAKLHELWKNDSLGSENEKSGDLELYIRFRPEEVEEGEPEEAEEGQVLKAHCGKVDLTACINAWESLPPLKPPVPIDVDEHGPTGVVAEVQREDIGPELPQA